MFGTLDDILRLTVRPGSNVELFCELNLLPRIGNLKLYPTWHSKAWGVVVWLTEDWQARYKGRTSHELNLIPRLKLTTKAWPFNQALQSEHFAITTSPHWPCTRPFVQINASFYQLHFLFFIIFSLGSITCSAPGSSRPTTSSSSGPCPDFSATKDWGARGSVEFY